MGILANHVPSVEALKAGVVEVIEDAGSQSKKWFSKSRLLGVVEAGSGIRGAMLEYRENEDESLDLDTELTGGLS